MMDLKKSLKEEMDEELFTSRQICILLLYIILLKYFSPTSTLNWRLNSFVSRQGKGINKKNENSIIIIQDVAFSVLY